MFWFVDRCLFFCPFSFGHCVFCSSSIYGFWLPLWYLQTPLIIRWFFESFIFLRSIIQNGYHYYKFKHSHMFLLWIENFDPGSYIRIEAVKILFHGLKPKLNIGRMCGRNFRYLVLGWWYAAKCFPLLIGRARYWLEIRNDYYGHILKCKSLCFSLWTVSIWNLKMTTTSVLGVIKLTQLCKI